MNHYAFPRRCWIMVYIPRLAAGACYGYRERKQKMKSCISGYPVRYTQGRLCLNFFASSSLGGKKNSKTVVAKE